MLKKTNITLNLIITYSLVVVVAYLFKDRLLLRSGEGIKVSDYVAATIAILSALTGAVATVLAFSSLRNTKRSEEGQLYLQMMDRYEGLADAMRVLGSFRDENRDDLNRAISDWSKQYKKGDAKAMEIEKARHKIKYYYRDLIQLYQGGYLSKELTLRIMNTGGRHLFKQIILTAEPYTNKFSFEGEFKLFDELYEELREKQKPEEQKKHKVVCLIPARLDSTRFDSKLMQKLGGKTVIRFTYENVVSMELFDEVAVVTNSPEIKEEIEGHGGKAIYLDSIHTSGSDRIAEAAWEMFDVDIIVNVQGDEPFVKKEPLRELIETVIVEDKKMMVASLMRPMDDDNHIRSADYVKVVCDKRDYALYFSRNVIPYDRRQSAASPVYYEHIGVYAFTRDALLWFSEKEPSPLELFESVECLRYLENTIPIKMIKTDELILEIDTPADLQRAEAILASS